MELITRKSRVKELLDQCFNHYDSGLINFSTSVNQHILSKKVKFPLLEFCGLTIYKTLSEEEHIPFCNQIQSLKTEGGNVILGIILQKRLHTHFDESMQKATEYIADADIWYVCDIIGERVYGYSLLYYPKETIQVIQKLSHHKTNWVIRSLGAGTHYAIKKGLDIKEVTTLFKLLLSMAGSNDKEIRQGIGWAAKTTAKFHPTIIDSHKNEIENTKKVANWFRKKIEIGLNRYHYAQRN